MATTIIQAAGRPTLTYPGALALGIAIPVVAVILGAAILYSPIGMPLLAFGLHAPNTTAFTLAALALLCAVGCPVVGGIWACVAGRLRPFGLSWTVSAGVAAGVFAADALSTYVDDLFFLLFENRSSEVIEAVLHHQETRGTLPTQLDELVPSLLSHVPGTGLPVAPRYTYFRGPGSCPSGNEWYLSAQWRSSQATAHELFYCPNVDHDLRPIERNFSYEEFRRIGRWVYSTTDLDD